MTVEEIFNKIISHMLEGLTYHDELARAFDFLGLYGYAKCHDYHHFEEAINYRELSHYYTTHFFKLIQFNEQPKHNLIPDIWYKYTSQAVDSNTLRNSIKSLMKSWCEWELSTKKLYQQMYNELTSLSEVAAAHKISKYLCDVDKELHNIQKEILELEAINYNLDIILPEQSTLRNKYKKAIKNLYKEG